MKLFYFKLIFLLFRNIFLDYMLSFCFDVFSILTWTLFTLMIIFFLFIILGKNIFFIFLTLALTIINFLIFFLFIRFIVIKNSYLFYNICCLFSLFDDLFSMRRWRFVLKILYIFTFLFFLLFYCANLVSVENFLIKTIFIVPYFFFF